MPKQIKSVRIDEDECVGCESCVDLCPDVFEMDEDAQKAIVIESHGGDEECIQEAIDTCPVECIEWQEE